MTNNKALLKLIKCVLPNEIVDSFELVSLNKSGEILDIYLEESNITPEEYKGKKLSSNGFYEKSRIKDFPLQNRKTILHVRRKS